MSKKILLAEDDLDDQHFFYQFLHKRPDLILLPPVENGEELMTFLESEGNDNNIPDAIILDQNMPKRNGLQTLSLLKNNSKYADIPVMIYSTYADEMLKQKGISSGAKLVVPKPSDGNGYHKMLDDFLDVM